MEPGSPAAGAVEPGDDIKEVQFQVPGLKDGEKVWVTPFPSKEGLFASSEDKWARLEKDQWAAVFWAMQGPNQAVEKVRLKVQRKNETILVELTPREDATWPRVSRGLRFQSDMQLRKADSLTEAVLMGLQNSYTQIKLLLLQLKAIVLGRVSATGLGGPATIAAVMYSSADNFYEFLSFLGFISINLAVINFLPIPLLDGGHMVFLLYELVRGKPAPEQVRVGLSYLGLFLILGLMVFVIYLDITRLPILKFFFQ